MLDADIFCQLAFQLLNLRATDEITFSHHMFNSFVYIIFQNLILFFQISEFHIHTPK